MGADLYRRPTGGKHPGRKALHDRIDELVGHLYGANELLPDDAAKDRSRKEMYALMDQRDADDPDGTPWYFRDSYNDSNLFWMMDMSWWGDLQPYLGPDGDGVMEQTYEDGEGPFDDYRLHPVGMRKLLDEVIQRSELLHKNMDDRGLPMEGEPFTNIFGQPDTEIDQRYFSEKLQRFIRFLRGAMEDGDTIFCSI